MQEILTKSQIEKCKKILKDKVKLCRKAKDYLSCKEAEEIDLMLKNLDNPNSHHIHLIKNIIEENPKTNSSIIERLNKNFKDPWKNDSS